MNQVILLGRVGNNPELRGSSGYQAVTFSVATNEYTKSKDKEDEYLQYTDWHNIVVFQEALRDIVMENVTIGMRVQIQGAIKYYNYENKNGVQMKSVSIVAKDVIRLQSSNSPNHEIDDRMLSSLSKVLD